MNNSNEFNPNRLSVARLRRGLTKTQLASLIGITTRSITAYESGEFTPEREQLIKLSKTLYFPVNFFFGDDLEEITPDIVSFRSLSKMTASQRNSALGTGAIALLLNKWIEDRFELPKADLPDLSQEVNPEAAADILRRMWGLGELPIKNIIHLLESKGIRLFSLSIDTSNLDAFSMWSDETPFIFLNTKKSCERSRFDTAHELAHLILHKHAGAKAKGQVAEREADAFASAFLMPRSSVLANAPYMATVDQLVRHKVYWTVSVAALAHRLHDVGLVSDWHYRTLTIEVSKRGYRKQEPNEAQREISQVLAKVFSALREDGVTKADIAEALFIHTEEIDRLVFGLVLTCLAAIPGNSSNHSGGKRPELHIIKGGK
jgi:Zn-dependent peptidase ImmA (M78 family)/DNA-binding XRE family transcriptional regulator